MNEEKEKRLTESAELEAPTTANESESDTENATDDDSTKTITGYALKFGEPSKDLGGFVEVITAEALKEVDLSNVILLHGHDYSKPLASVKAGTLKLEVDEIGLKFEATLTDTSYAKDVYENIKAGIVDSMSFGFEVGLDSFEENEEGTVTRSIENMKALHEISIVTVPAYDQTNVQVSTRSYTKFLEEKGGDNMKLNTLNNQNTEIRSFEDFIRAKGEVRDGLTTAANSAGVVVPAEVIGEVFDLKRSEYNLAQYATVKPVSNGQGKYPVATNQTAVLATKEELAQIADVDADMFTQVQYAVATRAGKIALSNEVVEDAAVDVVAEVKAQLKKLVDNTDNKHIIDLLKSFTKVDVTAVDTFDQLKKVNNVDLDPALNKMVIVNQDTFQYLDTVKDKEGRYLLQPDVTAPSGFSLFGNPVVVLSNKVFTPATEGALPMVLGDIEQSVFVARRNQVETQWEQFDYYSQGLAVIVRNDYQVIDADAARYVEITPSTGA